MQLLKTLWCPKASGKNRSLRFTVQCSTCPSRARKVSPLISVPGQNVAEVTPQMRGSIYYTLYRQYDGDHRIPWEGTTRHVAVLENRCRRHGVIPKVYIDIIHIMCISRNVWKKILLTTRILKKLYLFFST